MAAVNTFAHSDVLEHVTCRPYSLDNPRFLWTVLCSALPNEHIAGTTCIEINGLYEQDEESAKDLVDLFGFHCSQKCPSVARPILKLLVTSRINARQARNPPLDTLLLIVITRQT
jgi:hypothetical protein